MIVACFDNNKIDKNIQFYKESGLSRGTYDVRWFTKQSNEVNHCMITLTSYHTLYEIWEEIESSLRTKIKYLDLHDIKCKSLIKPIEEHEIKGF